VLLASGKGAILGRESGVTGGDFLVAHDVQASGAIAGEPVVRIATAIEADWLEPTAREIVHRLDGDLVRAVERRYGRIVLQRPVPPDPRCPRGSWPGPGRARLGALSALRRRRRLRRTRRWIWKASARAPFGDTGSAVSWTTCSTRGRRTVDLLAPETLSVPSSRRPLDYRADGSIVASVKLQELFGLGESPRLGPKKEAVLLLLLAPNGRPVQTTRDLRGFWTRTYRVRAARPASIRGRKTVDGPRLAPGMVLDRLLSRSLPSRSNLPAVAPLSPARRADSSATCLPDAASPGWPQNDH
jgi:ATP-dependent helicase HrpB